MSKDKASNTPHKANKVVINKTKEVKMLQQFVL
jgi:hypothetical protein